VSKAGNTLIFDEAVDSFDNRKWGFCKLTTPTRIVQRRDRRSHTKSC
jgi:hypothetical protein